MARRRRNKLVVWEWSPNGKHEVRDAGRKRSSVRSSAIGAALLLAGLIFFFSSLPRTSSDYRRDLVGTFLCERAGVEPGTPRCGAVAIGGWFAIVLTVGVVLKIARVGLRAAGFGRHTR